MFQWQLVRSALSFVKLGYYLFYVITTESKTIRTNPGAASIESRSERTVGLVQIFSSKTEEFIEVLDCAFHKKPTTTDWAAIATSVALIFDMFQYEFYLLHVSLIFYISAHQHIH